MYEVYYKYFKVKYGASVKPLMTDTDSMILHIKSPTLRVEDMQANNSGPNSAIKFDLSKAFGKCQNKGKLRCFKVEDGSDIIHAGVFLMSKMYALKQYSPEGVVHTEMKGKIEYNMKETTTSYYQDRKIRSQRSTAASRRFSIT